MLSFTTQKPESNVAIHYTKTRKQRCHSLHKSPKATLPFTTQKPESNVAIDYTKTRKQRCHSLHKNPKATAMPQVQEHIELTSST
jgi:hypothetical protein